MGKGIQTAPIIARLGQDGKVSHIRLAEYGTPVPYSKLWSAPRPGYPADLWKASRLAELGQDSKRYQQLSVRRVYQLSAELYLKIHGRYCDWNTLQSSGLTPHAPGTINPLTGKPWRGDGSPNDLYFSYLAPGQQATRGMMVIRSTKTDAGSFQCFITDENGNTPWSI
jgi:hypothetical protein